MLQGSLENFALDEVLGLLASTNKTGQLEISGDRGTGSLMFSDGRLVDGTASHTANGTEVEDVMFELLRYADGSFTFTNREVEGAEKAQNVASVLSGAEHRLQDWRQIEAVVPTLSHQVSPAAELPADEVTISREEWAALTVIAAGCPASLICDQLSLGEVEGSRQIKNLAERELVTVTEPLGGFNAVSRGTGSLPARHNEPVADLGVTTQPLAAEEIGAVPAALDVPAALNTPAALDVPASLDVPAALSAPEAFEVGDTADSSIMESLSDDSLSDGILSIDAMSDGMGPGGFSTDTGTDFEAADRPPMPPIPTPDELIDNGGFGTPPAPPSPEEISNFSENFDDISGLVEDAEDSKGGGLLARYRKNDD